MAGQEYTKDYTRRFTSARVSGGGPVPLFDRLVDMQPDARQEAHIWRRLSVAEVEASVATELSRLFDARRAEPLAEAARRSAADLTVLDYGLPEFGAWSPADPNARRLMAMAMRQAIMAFEPRLAAPTVELTAPSDRPGLLSARISGRLVAEDGVEPVTYLIDLGSREAAKSRADGDGYGG